MKEKAFSLTGDDFTIKTVAGMEVCKCKGKVLSISDKKGVSRAFLNLAIREVRPLITALQCSRTCKEMNCSI